MRHTTVKRGLRLMTVGIVAVILATFFHDRIAALFSISPDMEMQIVYLGLFGGALFGFCGIALVVLGFLRAPGAGTKSGLFPAVAILVIVILLFFIFLYSAVTRPEQPRIQPGESITI